MLTVSPRITHTALDPAPVMEQCRCQTLLKTLHSLPSVFIVFLHSFYKDRSHLLRIKYSHYFIALANTCFRRQNKHKIRPERLNSRIKKWQKQWKSRLNSVKRRQCHAIACARYQTKHIAACVVTVLSLDRQTCCY
jgi:hypothetical protein